MKSSGMMPNYAISPHLSRKVFYIHGFDVLSYPFPLIFPCRHLFVLVCKSGTYYEEHCRILTMQTICEVIFPSFGRALSEQISNDLNMHRFRNPRGSACSHGGALVEALKAAAFGPRGSISRQHLAV